MGYWAILSSVDEMDEHSDFAVNSSSAAAVQTLREILPAPGRVACEQIGEFELDVLTLKHTPAWVFLGLVIPVIALVLMFAVRVTRRARVTVESSPTGCVLHVRGKLDTRAAVRLRALRAE